jgi:hypothetical protein
MAIGPAGTPGPSDRSREKELAHRLRYRSGAPAGEQLEILPPSTPNPEPKRAALFRLWDWIVRRWNGD